MVRLIYFKMSSYNDRTPLNPATQQFTTGTLNEKYPNKKGATNKIEVLSFNFELTGKSWNGLFNSKYP